MNIELAFLIVLAFGLLWGSSYFFVKSLFGERGACRYRNLCGRGARSSARWIFRWLGRLGRATWRWASPRVRRLVSQAWRKLTR